MNGSQYKILVQLNQIHLKTAGDIRLYRMFAKVKSQDETPTEFYGKAVKARSRALRNERLYENKKAKETSARVLYPLFGWKRAWHCEKYGILAENSTRA